MSGSKEPLSLPSIKTRTRQKYKAKIPLKATVPSVQELVARQVLKKVSLWFRTWRSWQQRVFVCRVMEHCSRHQLRFLATALEPVLHFDFSTSLVPHLASLHVDATATFQVQRGLTLRVFSPAMLESEPSMAPIQSLPTTLLTRSSEATLSKQSKSVNTREVEKDGMISLPLQQRKERARTILPILPLTHDQHAQVSVQSNLGDVVGLRHTRFSSVPNLKTTTDILRTVKHKEPFRPQHHKRSHTVNTYLHKKARGTISQTQYQAELFKMQLLAVSQWMMEWPAIQQSNLLLEVVKLYDKDLLAYFVQCLYQRLHDQMSIDSLTDAIILKVFHYLDVKSLCRSSQVCQRWHHISLSADIWQHHCRELGRVEGVGDLVTAVKLGCLEAEGRTVDWKWVYRDLLNVIERIKKIVVKAAAEREEEEEAEKMGLSSKITRAALRAGLSLREMIELIRSQSCTPLSTMQEVLNSAPESAIAARRRARKEMKEAKEAKLREDWERALSNCYQHRRPYDRSTPNSRLECLALEEDQSQDLMHQYYSKMSANIELIQPDPDGVRCLVLAGCLLHDQLHKPGKAQLIQRLRRLKPLDSVVLCLQCDQKKIVCGTEDRALHIYDIRSGRHINTLTGHKGSIKCLQFDDFKMVSGSWDTTCVVWDIVHYSAICELTGHTGCISCLQFDSQRLVTGSHDRSIRIWSISSWECITVIGNAHKEPVICLTFNSSCIATGAADKCIKLWSLATSKPLATLPHPDALSCLLFSNSLLVSACCGGVIRLWSMELYQLPRALLNQALPPPAPVTEWQLEDTHWTGMVLEGDKILGSGSDNSIYEWDIATGTFTRTLTGHSRPVTCIGATQSKLVSASEDQTICVWHHKERKALKKEEEVLVVESDPDFPDIPIRVVTI